MQITIPVSDEEKRVTLEAITELNKLRHIKFMSQAMIAEGANLKPTKIRLVLQTLIDDGLIVQYQVSQNKRLQRYYYVPTDAGASFKVGEEDDTEK